jgi:hypothetical protein
LREACDCERLVRRALGGAEEAERQAVEASDPRWAAFYGDSAAWERRLAAFWRAEQERFRRAADRRWPALADDSSVPWPGPAPTLPYRALPDPF